MGGVGALTFSFLMGAGFGVYLSQNYAVPDLRYWLEHGFVSLRKVVFSIRDNSNSITPTSIQMNQNKNTNLVAFKSHPFCTLQEQRLHNALHPA
mmetsp:Transcript_5931/g.10533  ORF Transcript_5931/g.10533 Transcript_5931/m.10533 type:complete len:94 (-) Transcript_5931:3395-3676(-)